MNCDSLPKQGAEWTFLSSHEILMSVLCLRAFRKSVGRAYREGQELVIVDTSALLSLRSPALAVYASGVETRDGVKTRGSAGM